MKGNRLMIRGLGIWSTGFIFLVLETIYFGSNWWPDSLSEGVCDIVGGSICLGGLTTFSIGLYLNIKS